MELTPEAQRLAFIVAAVVVLWFTEALPLAVTALLGAVACVIAGVAPAKEVFRPFADPLIFLFIGSFLLAEAIRLHRLDRRLAYAVLATRAVGERPVGILAAVVVVSVLISAFISNTVTAAMMLAIVTGILAAIEEAGAVSGIRPASSFATGLLLSIAFAASIGGLATPIGTPTNLIGLGFIRNELGVDISFPGWCAISLPLVTVFSAILVVIMARLFPAGVSRLDGVQAFVRRERARLGPWSVGQWSTAVAFGITVMLWIVPGLAVIGLGADHEASRWLRDRLPEGVAALVGAILLFVLPGDRTADGQPRRALSWRDARIDWDIVLLYGGGLALGELCFSTGLAAAAGGRITAWIPHGAAATTALVAVAALVAVVTSEFTSNVASATMVVPIVIAMSRTLGAEPVAAALAATMAASLGFMMPVSSPCNALVYGSGRIPLRAMMASGLILDVIGWVMISATMLAVSSAVGR
ncbi:MAG: SLC13 family permease [Planctomycetota bacterium]|nr:DASS family sodium-coupled anion symporter [Planctomycetota bacterium]